MMGYLAVTDIRYMMGYLAVTDKSYMMGYLAVTVYNGLTVHPSYSHFTVSGIGYKTLLSALSEVFKCSKYEIQIWVYFKCKYKYF